MKLKYINFIFENCASIKIDGKYIGDFMIEDIHTVISRVACNAIIKQEICKKFFIEIHKNADEEYYQFGYSKVFDRLKDNDITHISFGISNYDDKECEEFNYTLEWTGDSNYQNAASKVYISKLGHCYILVSENEELTEYIDFDSCNNANEMNLHFGMYNIEEFDNEVFE